jgi:hypothetical protein
MKSVKSSCSSDNEIKEFLSDLGDEKYSKNKANFKSIQFDSITFHYLHKISILGKDKLFGS